MFYVEVKGQPQVLVLSLHLAGHSLLWATHCVGQAGPPCRSIDDTVGLQMLVVLFAASTGAPRIELRSSRLCDKCCLCFLLAH